MDTMQGEEKSILLHNCTVIGMDLDFSEHPGKDVLLKHGYISAITDSTTSLATSEGNMKYDCSGLFVVPGLCDAHVHVTAVTANLNDLTRIPPTLMTARASKVLKGMLLRGFTTVRDAGGCDWGLAKVFPAATG